MTEKKALEDIQVEVWLQDETRIGQKSNPRRLWAKKGSRTRIGVLPGFLNTYLYGAVNPDSGESVGLIAPHVNIQWFEEHLKLISLELGKQRHAVLFVDQAAWHTSKRVSLPENITLYKLPAYSPELNGIERLWNKLKGNELANKVYKSIDDLENLVAQAWNGLSCGQIASVCSITWAYE